MDANAATTGELCNGQSNSRRNLGRLLFPRPACSLCWACSDRNIHRYLFTTHLLIDILVICGFFVGLILSLVRKYRIKAIMLICSVSLIVIFVWRLGEDQIRRYLYVAEVLVTPHFDKKCVPADGVLFNGDTLLSCSTHDFNLAGFMDVIVKISGPYPKERLIDDINSRKLTVPPVGVIGDELTKLGMWPDHVTGQHLLSDYYLIKVHICGNARPYC